ncbi:hypothetical protein [Verminephrobacter aporrectodeae]|uniref:hypothetical protein n=1 Tax=Verminephrobacter aporrectodeae TaxID=1110389 RepID=UPI0011104530|nr:hypothetical protein [Verminephrobacter aporrectodeae]
MYRSLNKIVVNNNEAIIDTSSFNSGCPVYKVFISNLTNNSTTGQGTFLRLQLYNGSSFPQGTYNSQAFYVDSGSSGEYKEESGGNTITLTSGNYITNNSENGVGGELTFHMPTMTSKGAEPFMPRTIVTWVMGIALGYQNRPSHYNGTGYDYASSYATKGFRLSFNNSIGFSTGLIRVYGLTE